MILDRLSESSRYCPLSPLFAPAFEFLWRLDGNLAPGRHEIEGTRLYAQVQAYQTRPTADARFEAHRRYIDIQYVFSGVESIYWAPVGELKLHTPYCEENDAALYDFDRGTLPVRVRAGEFCILYPEDAHAPCGLWGAESPVRKVVMKVVLPD